MARSAVLLAAEMLCVHGKPNPRAVHADLAFIIREVESRLLKVTRRPLTADTVALLVVAWMSNHTDVTAYNQEFEP